MQEQAPVILDEVVAEPEAYERSSPTHIRRTPRHRQRRASSLTRVLDSCTTLGTRDESHLRLKDLRRKTQSTLSLPALRFWHERGSASSSIPNPVGDRLDPAAESKDVEIEEIEDTESEKPQSVSPELYPVTPQYMMRLRYKRTHFQFVL